VPWIKDTTYGLPDWLFQYREDEYGMRVWRFGSRSVLRFVVTYICERRRPALIDRMVMVQVGKAGIQFGPAEAIGEGHAGLPRGSRSRVFWRWSKAGRGLGVSWAAGQ
jgi:hypothetical protein